jgi:hypothetical protein
MIIGGLRTVAMAAAMFGWGVNGLTAAECDPVVKEVKGMIDKFSPPKGDENKPKWCAAYAEGLGMMKIGRLLAEECLDEGEQRTKELAGMDRGMRRLQWAIDTNCQ